MSRAVFFVALLFAASAAQAATAISVIGTGYARGCFEAAQKRLPLRQALRVCDSALLDEALASNDRAATFVNRGIVQMQAKKLDAAIADYDAAIKVRPDIAEAYVNKGIALMQHGNRDDEAVVQLSEGIARNPLRPEIAYYTRGVANEGLGRAREAFEDYSRAAQLAPDWPEPAEQLQRFQTVRRKTGLG
ncbi:MAG: tetratricopeptide repeat protein [Polymorphobacter sp.]